MALIFAESCSEEFPISGVSVTISGWTASGGSGGQTTDRYAVSNGAWQPANANVPVLHRIFDAADYHATIIVGIAIQVATGVTGQNALLQFRDASNNVRSTVWLEEVSTNNHKIAVRVGTLTTGLIHADTTSTPVIAGDGTSWYYLEIKYVCHASTGAVTIRVGESIKGSGTSLNTTGGFAGTDIAQFGVCGFPSSRLKMDDIYICNGVDATIADASAWANNDFLGDVRVARLRANGNGDSSAWVGTDANSVDNYLQMDDVPPSVSVYNKSSTVNDQDLYNVTNTPAAQAGFNVFGVCVRHAMWCDNVPRGVSPVVKTSTESVKTEVALTTTVEKAHIRCDQVQPTGAKWSTSVLDTAQFGVKVTS